ncbi:MFS transporter [Pimelobacter simplex]|uniref:Major facilitator superfamily MFS_1 n=1 Tax=Nocardioides simplex TaxID=2045 RepID=A0A0A1DWX1_NOCSI|nr:MFS transporter [Pimelobacter simplex]AIY19960.2 major facilitator superfamily MFS_1 [Pimelobacter simplex]MCG8152835.1 MFS transporter [Pimelobacter simplex]GEB13501.1 tetracycline resistance protein [Pimelobacter simplex]SFM72617.1 Predicted arabinose efflux permease, MFS family [Pimelobacter simplex]
MTAAAQRRTVRVLVLTQAVGAVGITIGIATASLLARDLSGSEALSGLAQTAQVLGAAVISFLLAPLMARRGRRTGLMTGYVIGAAGGLTAVLAGVVGSMAVLLSGAMLLGAATSANNAARYAATDLATDENRARSLSLVVWATTIGAVAGPNLTGPAGSLADRLGIPELTGPFAIGAIGMLTAAVVVGVLLRPDPLLLAQEAAGTRERGARTGTGIVRTGSSWSRARDVVRERPVLGFAIVGLALTHATMIGVMTMTPLHMEHGGSGLEVIGIVISVHVLGMFAFSPLVGMLADRFGRPQVLGAGGVVLLVALVLCASSPSGMSWQVTAGLFLLGLGWSLSMVAASTMVAEHTPIAVRTDVQGVSDLIMGLTAAGGGALAGLIVSLGDYPMLALLSLVLVVGVLGCAVRAASPTRRTA